MKRQTASWEKIFANHASDKGLIYKLYKELMWFNSQSKNKSNLKMDRGFESKFFQRRYMDGQQAHGKKLTLLMTREIRTKTTMRHHLTSVRMAIIKKDNKSQVLTRI